MEIVYNIASKVFSVSKDEVKVIERLLGGRSNKTYLIEVNGKKYNFRVPGKKAEMFVDRVIEKDNLNLATELGINTKVIYLDINDGYLITEHIEGVDLTQGEAILESVAELLKKMHNSGLKSRIDYAPFERLSIYESYHTKVSPEYLELKGKLLQHKDYLESVEKVLCHNDFQKANIIRSTNDEFFLLDWEFAGNNDPIYDIACFGNFGFSSAVDLLNVYYENPSKDHLKRLHLWRMFQTLQWHNVALYKEEIGLSVELNVNFKMFADNYLKTAEELYNLFTEI